VKEIKAMIEKNTNYILLLPGLICIMIVIIYPSIRTILMSFYDVKLLAAKQPFIGLQNYSKLFEENSQILKIVWNTLFFAAASLILGGILALYTAYLLNKPYRGRAFFRVFFLVPWVTPPVVAGAIWKLIYSEGFSPINGILMKLHIIEQPISFLGNTTWHFGPVNGPMLSMIVTNVWHFFPFVMITFLAAMQNIPGELYEAATVDGASKGTQFFHITLPMIFPVLEITLLLQGIWQFNNFNTSYLLTQGGPMDMTNLLAVKVYAEAFVNFKYSSAATISVLMFLVVLLPAIIYIKRTNKDIFH
jgi:multiple sugar transport system permease protein